MVTTGRGGWYTAKYGGKHANTSTYLTPHIRPAIVFCYIFRKNGKTRADVYMYHFRNKNGPGGGLKSVRARHSPSRPPTIAGGVHIVVASTSSIDN